MLKVSYLGTTWNHTSLKPLLMLKLLLESAKQTNKQTNKKTHPPKPASCFLQHPISAPTDET